ncbi:CoA-binding domain-containing protein [Azotobacter beijerinckii]|uniref:CoA-binding domain-containing protein n=1 Tax=Azotobacter beijerinckii TaxID=170623 RepID=A0A1H9LC49_9GAMM|nr:hypothetical protein [Azotobacter beijerinckii]SER09006.1 CoA-binding domain-containing protein [Azotobacter beijerinckii]
MIPRYEPTFAERYPVPLFVALLDLLIVVVAGFAAYYLRFDDFDMSGRYNTATSLGGIVVVFCLALGGVYGSQRGQPFLRQFRVLTIAWLAASGILLSLSFLLKVSESYSRLWFVSMLLIGWGLCLLLRFSAFLLLRRLRGAGRNLKTVLLVDSGGLSAGQLNSGHIREEYGFKVVFTLRFSNDEGWLDSLVAKVNEHGVHEVWLCLPLSEGGAVRSVLYALRHHTVAIRFIFHRKG